MKLKYKIINDPVHGFISIKNSAILRIIDHPLFQRLRYISQMGLSYLVYPGAHHTRLQHAVGSMYLMDRAVEILRSKGIEITEEEKKAVMAAVLLHDIGHGPFSHALEYAIVTDVHHEKLSVEFMKYLNEEFENELDLALEIFSGTYHKGFLHELISSQLDMDRLDYLQRDSFFTGVIEGRINAERIIEMLNVSENRLTIEEKGIYSVEKFIVSRRFMYWQVYFHKTSFMFEKVLEQTLRRAKHLYQNGIKIYLDEDLKYFFDTDRFNFDKETLYRYGRLSDADILIHLKKWSEHPDFVLRFLAGTITKRKPMKVEIYKENIQDEYLEEIRTKIRQMYQLNENDLSFMVLAGQMMNMAYDRKKNPILIQLKNGQIKEFSETTDHFYIQALSQSVVKNYVIYPKNH